MKRRERKGTRYGVNSVDIAMTMLGAIAELHRPVTLTSPARFVPMASHGSTVSSYRTWLQRHVRSSITKARPPLSSGYSASAVSIG
jgi:hypothetical protein